MNDTAAPANQQEIDLINAARQGDRWAFSELVRGHQKGATNVVYRMCGDVQLAEDAVQEAFIRAWQRLHTYKPRSSFRSWLYRIAVNAALDMLRRQKATVDIEALPIAAAGQGPEKVVETRERAENVRQAVLALPETSRAVLVLREYEGLSYKEIADTLGIPIGTVMSRLNYARKRLLEVLNPYMEVR